MDVWQNIMKRVAEMNAADSEQAKKDAIADAKAKRKQEELNEIILVVGVLIVVFVVVGIVGYNAWDYCQTNRCGK
jgi:t-SNARE complex subunit (syntaxin)